MDECDVCVGWACMKSPEYPGTLIVRKQIGEKVAYNKKLQAFCEENGLRYPLGVLGYTESNDQCWQAETRRFHYLICIFPRWPPN